MLGSGGIQLALRQRKLDTIVVDKDFTEQRTDVSVEFPGSSMRLVAKGIVLEVDGPAHGTTPVKRGDERRDEACEKAGWAKTYRHRLWNNCNESDPIDIKHSGVAKALQHPYLRRIVSIRSARVRVRSVPTSLLARIHIM